MITKDQMVTALVPYMQSNNPGRSVDEIKSFLRQMTPQDLENTYNHAAPLDPDTEAKLAADADKAVQRQMLLLNLEEKNKLRSEQHRQNARLQFADMARQLDISNCDTNFNIAYDLHPSVFNVDDIRQFMESGRLGFIPPTAEEQADRDQSAKEAIVDQVLDSLKGHFVKRVTGVETRGIPFDTFLTPSYGESKEQNRARNIRALLDLPLETLRQLHQQADRNRAVKSGQPVERQPDQPNPDFNSGSGIDRANGGVYQDLPLVNGHGEKIDAAYLVRLANVDLDRYKMLIKKHGYFNLTQRIKGLG